MQYVQHSRALPRRLGPESGEQPVQAVGVGELRAVGVVAFDDGGCGERE